MDVALEKSALWTLEEDNGYVLFYSFISWQELFNRLNINNKMECFNYKGEH